MDVIRNVASRSVQNSTWIEDYAARLNGRLEVLARSQAILSRHENPT